MVTPLNVSGPVHGAKTATNRSQDSPKQGRDPSPVRRAAGPLAHLFADLGPDYVPPGRAEDLAWMTAHGESLSGAAARLGLNPDALDKWARNHTPDLIPKLLANEPANCNGSGANQWKAAT